MQRPCGRSVPSILEKQKEACVAGAEYVVGGEGESGGDEVRKVMVVSGWVRILKGLLRAL